MGSTLVSSGDAGSRVSSRLLLLPQQLASPAVPTTHTAPERPIRTRTAGDASAGRGTRTGDEWGDAPCAYCPQHHASPDSATPHDVDCCASTSVKRSVPLTGATPDAPWPARPSSPALFVPQHTISRVSAMAH